MSIHGPQGGPYVVRWRDDAGKNRQRTFTLKSDAQEWDGEVRRLKQRGHLGRLDGGKMTLSQFLNDTFIPDVLAQRAPRTQTFYRDILSAHVLPDLGTVPLAAITAKRLRAWQRDRLNAGAGRYALNRALVLVGQVLQHAAEEGELEQNVAQLVRKVEEHPTDAVVPLAPITVERILARLPLRDHTIVSLLAYAGLRPGEVYGLRWQDLGEHTIHVQRAVDGMGGLKTTKTKATRSVRFLPTTAADVAAWRDDQGRVAAKALVFPVRTQTKAATKDIMDNWRERTWRPALASARVEYQRPYDLRHSYASLLLAEGRNVHYVAQQLGHDPKLTLSTYGHLIAEYEHGANIDPDAEIQAARAKVAAGHTEDAS
ncbi:unannotated protein [freshwater metagenome]|uniref:Unannotated protein n=1 Tax=freshwater metagenome TaxID=449393 RepID=A0A6J7FQW4_9ZZZZ|nr:tyrosine-type recombinase/integrase [Actinomycetota bacterium]